MWNYAEPKTTYSVMKKSTIRKGC